MNENHPDQKPKKLAEHSIPHADPALPKMIAFDSLAEGQPEVLIEFHGQIYRLRSTRNNKLILNK